MPHASNYFRRCRVSKPIAPSASNETVAGGGGNARYVIPTKDEWYKRGAAAVCAGTTAARPRPFPP